MRLVVTGMSVVLYFAECGIFYGERFFHILGDQITFVSLKFNESLMNELQLYELLGSIGYRAHW